MTNERSRLGGFQNFKYLWVGLGKGRDCRLTSAIPPALPTTARRVCTIAAVPSALNSRKATNYEGEYRGPLQPEWVFQDEGYSGAFLVRPGLEALRDLAAEGQIVAALVYSPDAYQVLLSEELSRCGVELIFLKAPAGATPEDQLPVQFQGMIAE